MPEGRNKTAFGGGAGFSIYKGGNTEAARTLLEFMSQPAYLAEFPFAYSPVHYYTPFLEVQETEAYQSRLNELPDAWSDRDIETYQQDIAENSLIYPNETEPPNPFAAVIWSSTEISDFVGQCLINDANPDNLIDDVATSVQEAIDDAEAPM